MTITHRNGTCKLVFVSIDEAIRAIPEDSVVVTDDQVAEIYGSRLNTKRPLVAVPAGEPSKSVASWASLQARLAAEGVSRATTVVAFGGGVVGDLAGFAAATYMRGVPLIQIPTSLLAQVDSSVGGKVGIDLKEGKNLVGSFWPPKEVHVATEFLKTLPERHWKNGMAEVWKYGFVFDSAFVETLSARQRDPDLLVRTCINFKKRVVEADEFERLGERAKLNFGHTVGHAIEKVGGYDSILHGEAISVGMVAEAAIGEAIGLSEAGTRASIEECLSSEGLPTTSVVLRDTEVLLEAMRGDKKSSAGRLTFSLLRRIGSCKLMEDVPESEVRRVLADL